MRRTGKRLMPSQAVAKAYADSIRPLVKAMSDTVKSAIKRQRLWRTRGRVLSVFDIEAERLAQNFAERVVRYTAMEYRKAAKGLKGKRAVKTDMLTTKKSARAVRRIVRETARLIRSIPRKYLKKVDAAIEAYNDGMLRNGGFDARMEELERQCFTRVNIIAHDQNNKATESLMLLRMDEDGVRLVKWCHSHLSEKPREYHLRKWDGHTGKRNGKPNGLNGYIFDISKPPVIDKKTGERGFPAQLINCKCFLVPVEDY